MVSTVRDRVRVFAAGKLVTSFAMATALALGADAINTARGFMFALGCIQSQSCHTNRCPVGLATQDKTRQRALDVSDKADRVYNFHLNTLEALAEFVAALGLDHPRELRPDHLYLREGHPTVMPASQAMSWLETGELLSSSAPEEYSKHWQIADPQSFRQT